MKTIKIKFADFWPEFDPRNDIFYDVIMQSGKYDVQIVDEDPEYLIYSVFGDDHLRYDCVKIFFTGEEACPDFNLCDYAIGFEYMDFGDRYIRYPQYLLHKYKNDYDDMRKRKSYEKTEFCSFVYTNNSNKVREEFFNKLCEYKKINSGGKFLNNIGEPVKDKVSFESKHKFSIAFENCSHPGYTTEKIVQSFAAGTVPIYWGNPLVEKEFNGKAFVNVHNFSSLDEVVEYITKLDNDDVLYNKMLQEKAVAGSALSKEEMEKKLYSFFDNIFSQDYDRAFRRTRISWNAFYRERMIRYSKFYKVYTGCAKIYGVYIRCTKIHGMCIRCINKFTHLIKIHR